MVLHDFLSMEMEKSKTDIIALFKKFSLTSYGDELLQNFEENFSNLSYQIATFGAGCFWGVESNFRELEGIIGTLVGFMGGTTPHPTYKQVCTNKTGHAEVLQLIFNPERISYKELLQVFWKIHNPTTLNRQGPDIGSQYRSVIFYHSDQQKTDAEAMKTKLTQEHQFKLPIVTEISPAEEFFKAEDYHQLYNETKRAQYCCSL